MPTVCFHTLGCKVNQYDTQAMRELLLSAGYTEVSFGSPADVCLLNTCTVTGTGDKKSLQLARRFKRENPGSLLVLCGCMAQKKAETLLKDPGADLVLGTRDRGDIVSLIDKVLREKKPLCAVSPLTPGMPYENLEITDVSEHTRATVKIQEGCDNRCTYCIIPAVRGPIRSRPLEDILREVCRLSREGFSEVVLTGIHLASYGLDFPEKKPRLIDVIEAVHGIDGIRRIRLGSLEPVVANDAFCETLRRLPKVCPQFHLALQSGSDTVLARMKRRYNTAQYLRAVERLRAVYPRAAMTTDILTGFPGETEAEYRETREMIERVGFARIHVFPYSPREDTPAAVMPDQLSTSLKEQRSRELIALGKTVAEGYLRQWIGRDSLLLAEEKIDGAWEGYTPEYIRVRLPESFEARGGDLIPVRLTALREDGMTGIPIDSEDT